MLKLHKGAVESAIHAFRDHKARLSKGFFMDVLDWKRPNTNTYWIRMVFDHERSDTHAVYITGDLGEAIIYPTCPATLFNMAKSFTFINKDGSIDINEHYFLEKVKTANHLYDWSMEDFQDDLRDEYVERYGKDEDQRDLENFFEEHCDGYLSDVTIDNSMGVQIDSAAKDDLHLLFPDYDEWISGCGQRVSNFVAFWLVAMRMAYEQTKEKEDGEK